MTQEDVDEITRMQQQVLALAQQQAQSQRMRQQRDAMFTGQQWEFPDSLNLLLGLIPFSSIYDTEETGIERYFREHPEEFQQ